MYDSLRSMAHTTVSLELDATELAAFRGTLLDRESELGARITMTDLFATATCRMLQKHPLANARWNDTEINTYPFVDLSVAVAADYGLMSPVIHDADAMDLVTFSRALHALVERARGNKLTREDTTGGTFTITNMGVYPIDAFTPIINPPQSAIMGFGRAVDKPAVHAGQIAVRTMMTLSLTYDHRVFDGSEAGAIMSDMQRLLEHPEYIFI
jgi:pyruvate/2-oxoglutarate dehydrogenase complex dihydrolipoamide acyltransferase (E2) component